MNCSSRINQSKLECKRRLEVSQIEDPRFVIFLQIKRGMHGIKYKALRLSPEHFYCFQLQNWSQKPQSWFHFVNWNQLKKTQSCEVLIDAAVHRSRYKPTNHTHVLAAWTGLLGVHYDRFVVWLHAKIASFLKGSSIALLILASKRSSSLISDNQTFLSPGPQPDSLAAGSLDLLSANL